MATEETTADKRIKPHHLALGLGVGVAAFTAVSGITPLITKWHDESPIGREVFFNIPGWMKLAFYIVVPMFIVYGAYMFSLRMRNWERGQPDKRATTTKNVKTRAENYRSGVYMQTLLRDPAAGVMHSFIYFSFLVLLAVTTVLEINHQVPVSWKFLHGTTYQAYSLVGDTAGIFLFVGVSWAIIRRYVARPYRIRIKTKSDHALGLGTLFALALTGFLAEGWRIALEGTPAFEKWSIVGYPIATAVDGMGSLSTMHRAWWLVHVASFLTFLFILPVTMMRHMFTSPLNMFLRDKDRPKGAMRPMPNLMETELENFGASVIEDFTWKQLLDTDSCTMCGRCTAQCPAHLTGKPLDPREIVLKVGEVMARTG
ncbi:MAG TPA: respiratory nitrate reductase subunit gamma, partial [Acidimicrobiales bacterium]|nr:respiratory nitrate reductase subunit gamma [Acidimicrobiales bacterium]